MRIVPNNVITTLLRCLPLIFANLNEDAMRANTRLYNAVRQIKIILKKLKKIDNEHQSD